MMRRRDKETCRRLLVLSVLLAAYLRGQPPVEPSDAAWLLDFYRSVPLDATGMHLRPFLFAWRPLLWCAVCTNLLIKSSTGVFGFCADSLRLLWPMVSLYLIRAQVKDMHGCISPCAVRLCAGRLMHPTRVPRKCWTGLWNA